MSSSPYCEERAPVAGSSSYYAVRMAPDRLQSLSLYVLLKELFSIVTVSDASVAHAKLAWWRAEIARLENGTASHPLAEALKAGGFAVAGSIEQLLRITTAVETDMTQSRFLDSAVLDQYLNAAAAAPARALAIAAGLGDAGENAAAALGVSIGHARIVAELGRHARQQRIYLPHQTLRDHEVPAADILAGRDTPNLRRLVEQLSRQAQQGLDLGLAGLEFKERRKLRSLAVLAALSRARLTEIAEDGFRVALHRVALTPIRKLTIAWRSAYFGS